MMIRSRFLCSSFLKSNIKIPVSEITTVLIRTLHHQPPILCRRHKHIDLQYVPNRGKKDDTNVLSLFKPVPIKVNSDDINIGAELTGQLDKKELLKILNRFTQKAEIKVLCKEYGIDDFLRHQAFSSFRRYCIDDNLPADLHITFSNILQGAGHVDDIFPYFIRYARKMFPHLDCMDDLKKISDLRTPANWYPCARAIQRKIIFHAGPTNSGKIYHAIDRLMKANSGVYCGPLKLLAAEVFNKSNAMGTPCDLVTGEERRYAKADGTGSSHVACTVEMTSINIPYEVVVIDEIQMLKDPGRGWAWTRAFLGVIANEIHVCGEVGAATLLQRLCDTTGETVEIREYKRLTDLIVEDSALGSLDNVLPGDCIVCFNKNNIYSVSRQIESGGKEVSVIYGGLPPGTKLAQAAKFNDPDNSCKIMVIPLVQTFGHMEYVLKLEDFADLREHSRYLQCICPTNTKSSELIQEMIDQVMRVHPNLEYFHIGSDEVYYMGLCHGCQDRMTKMKLDRGELFLSHVTNVASYVKNKHKVQPIMWDDEFRSLDETFIMKYDIGSLVDILVWNYCSDVHNRIGPEIWAKYERIFKSLWIGSAFKGADQPNSLIVNETHYLSNHYSWMEIINKYQHRVNFKGIFLTGWQRYDHFTILCEIFPVAIPSLVSCMLYLDSVGQQPKLDKILNLAINFLNCNPNLQKCKFPGSQIFTNVLTLSSLQATMKNIKEQPVYLGWMHNVNLQNQFCSPSHVESILNHIVKLKVDLDGVQKNLLIELRLMFPEWCVQEWLHTHTLPLVTEVNLLEESLSKIFKKKTFPVRPLIFSDISSGSTLH